MAIHPRTVTRQKKIGAKLMQVRKDLNMGRKTVATLSGLGWHQVKAIEEGEGDFIFRSFIAYIDALKKQSKDSDNDNLKHFYKTIL